MNGFIANIQGTTEETFEFPAATGQKTVLQSSTGGSITIVRENVDGSVFPGTSPRLDDYRDYGNLDAAYVWAHLGLWLDDRNFQTDGSRIFRLFYDSTANGFTNGKRLTWELTPPPDSSKEQYLIYDPSTEQVKYLEVPVTSATDKTVLTADVSRSGGNKSFTIFTPTDALWRLSTIKIETPTGYNGATSANWKVGTATAPTLYANQNVKNNGSTVITPNYTRLTTTDPIIATYTDATDGSVGTSRLFARFERITLVSAN